MRPKKKRLYWQIERTMEISRVNRANLSILLAKVMEIRNQNFYVLKAKASFRNH